MKKQYYVLRGGKYVPVLGTRIEITGYEEFDFFVFKAFKSFKSDDIKYKRRWTAAEGVTGRRIGHLSYPTQREAIQHVIALVSAQDKSKLRQLIQQVEISPAYEIIIRRKNNED